MDWDRMNFGRVLRDLRSEAGLSQADLAERMGRDRRRLMAFEQGTAVREPRPGEIALLATGLGLPDALDRLRNAVGTQTARITDFYETVHEVIRADVANEVSRLLTKLDEVRQLARGLSRTADKSFLDEHITPAQLFRSGRAVTNVWLRLHCELLNQAQGFLGQLKQEEARFEASGKRPKTPDAVRAFKERQLRYWSRCDWASAKGQLDVDHEPDAVEQLIDELESTVFHLHGLVSSVAKGAIGAFGHLFLVWAGLALEVEPMRWPTSAKVSRTQLRDRNRVEAQRQQVALGHLIYALEKFLELPVPTFASTLMQEDWANPQGDNLQMVARVWDMTQDFADTIITECCDRLNLAKPMARFSPVAAQLKQAASSHGPSHENPENNG